MLRFLLFLFTFFIVCSFKTMRDEFSYYQSGVKHLEKGAFVAAIADFTHAISINPKYKEAYFQRAKAKFCLNEEVNINVKDALNDLITAKELGDKEAIKFLLKKSNIECYTITAKWKSKSDIFCLDYENENLARFPQHINELNSLLSLHLSNNKIRSLPPFLKLKNLLVLDMDNNKLEYLTNTIYWLSSLTELNLSSNYLRTLPNE
jgi:tetratricopeptide (TPR) repeat protein